MTTLSTPMERPLHWRALLADLVVGALLLGPLAAPFLQAWGQPATTISGIIYTMGTFVCPQPAQAPPLHGSYLMAVCMRCYGTVLGLLITRLIYAADTGASRFWLPRYGLRGLPIFAALIFAYAIELAGQIAGWWKFDNWGVTLAGLITGIGLGLMFHPILQRSDDSRPRTAAERV